MLPSAVLEALLVPQTLKEVFQDAYLDVLESSREAGGRGAVKACGCAAAQKLSDPGNAVCDAAAAGAVAARLQCECSSKGC